MSEVNGLRGPIKSMINSSIRANILEIEDILEKIDVANKVENMDVS